MLGFMFGTLVGAGGLWAYQSGHLKRWVGRAPQPVHNAMYRAVNSVAGAMHQTTAPEIIRPTPAEIAGRPAEPLPGQESGSRLTNQPRG